MFVEEGSFRKIAAIVESNFAEFKKKRKRRKKKNILRII